MSDIVKRAIETLNALPPERRDEAARMVLRYAGDGGAVYRLTAEEHAAQDASDADIASGNFATDDEMRALFDADKL